MINDLKEPGKVQFAGLITKCDVGRTAKGAPYLSLLLEDKSGVMDAKWWNLTDEQTRQFRVGQVVQAKGDILLHRNAIQLRVQSLTILPEEDITEYVRQAPCSRQEMEARVDLLVQSIRDDSLRQITKEVIDSVRDEYFTFPAATRNHHNFVGGLAWHSLCMADAATAILPLYPWLDEDLLMAGILLHDLGKTEELSACMLAEYTNAGNLLGHITMAVNRIDRAVNKLQIEDEETVTLLKHMVLSHHGKLEFGSPVLPMIPEAEVLTMLDNLDARLYMMRQSLDVTEPGHFGPRVFALDNRMIYRRNEKKEEEK